MADIVQQIVNEHILEIRYRPDPLVLDVRGELAASVLRNLELSEWQITENRVDVFSKDEVVRAFVSFKNAGITIRDTSLPDYFPNQATKFVRGLFAQKPFRDPISIERLGVRSRFGLGVALSFQELLTLFRTRLSWPTPAALEVYGANLVDIGYPMVFETTSGRIQSTCGPMAAEQLANFFGHEDRDRLPEVALYMEFDYFVKPGEPMSFKAVVGHIRQYAEENWDRYARLSAHILGR